MTTAPSAETTSDLKPDPDSGRVDPVKQAARGSALNMTGAMVATVVSFLTVGLITNHYGRAGAGLFFAATALFTLAANGARLGGESGLTYFVSRLRADDDHGALRPLVGMALRATAAVSTALAVVGLISAPWLARLLAADSANVRSLTTMIRILAMAVPAFALSQALFGASRGFGTMRPSVLNGQVVRPVVQLLLVVAAIATTTEIWPLAGAWSLAAVITAISTAWWLRRRLLTISTPDSSVRRNSYWRFAAPRALTDLLSSALERVDLLLVAYFLGEAQAGLYGVSNRLIVAGQLMMFATAQSMAPHLSAHFMQGRLSEARRVLHTISAWSVTLLWPVFLLLIFGADTILRLFGTEFAEGAPLVVILAGAMLIIVGLGVGDTLLLMTGQSMASLVNHAVGLVIMVALAAVLLPQIGVVGAAWSWAISRIVIRALAVFRVWRTQQVHGLGRPVLVAGGIALAAYGPSGLLSHSGVESGILAIAVHVAVGGLLHVALALRFRDVLALDQLRAIVRQPRPAP